MGATSGAVRKRVKRKAFAFAKEIRSANNAFGRKRKKYLTAVVQGDTVARKAIELNLVKKLRELNRPEFNGVLADNHARGVLFSFLRLGVPLSNALKISVLKCQRINLASKSVFLPHAQGYRKPEVLASEREILEFEYESLRLARRKAKEFGLSRLESQLVKEISARAKIIARYHKLFKKGFVT